MSYLYQFQKQKSGTNVDDVLLMQGLIEYAEALLSEADEEIDELKDDVSEAEEDAQNSRTELDDLTEKALHIPSDKSGIDYGIRLCMEVALEHARTTFGAHSPEYHFIEDILAQL